MTIRLCFQHVDDTNVFVTCLSALSKVNMHVRFFEDLREYAKLEMLFNFGKILLRPPFWGANRNMPIAYKTVFMYLSSMNDHPSAKLRIRGFKGQIQIYGFVLLFLAFIAGFASYFVSDFFHTKEIDTSNAALLSQSIVQLNAQLATLDNSSLIFMLNNPSLIQFMSMDYNDLDIGRKYMVTQDLRSRLRDIKGAHPSIHTIFLLSFNNDTALSEGGVNTLDEFNSMMNKALAVDSSRNVTYLRRMFYQGTANQAGIGTNAINTLILMRNYPVDKRNRQSGSLAILINESTMFDILSQALLYDEARISIVSDNDILVSITRNGIYSPDDTSMWELIDEMKQARLSTKDIDGRTIYMEYSPYTNWYYVLETPKGVGISVTRAMRDLFLYIIIGYTLLVFCMSYLSGRSAYGSLDKLARIIKRYSQENTQNNDIVSAVEYIFENNAALQGEVERIKPLAVQHMLNDLLRPGRVTDFSEHMDELERQGVAFERGGYAVAVLNGVIDANLGETLRNIIEPGIKITVLRISDLSHALIISFCNVNSEKNSMLLRNTTELLVESYDHLSIGVGRVYPSGIGISVSYREALEACKYCIFFPDQRTLYIEDIRSNLEFVSLGLDIAMQGIVSALKAGDTRSMIQGVEQYVRSMVDKRINIDMFHALLSSTIMQGLQAASDLGVDLTAFEQTELPQYSKAIEACESVEGIIAITQEMFLLIARNIAMRKNNRSMTQLGARAIQFVNEHYTDSEFSMLMLAELLGISDSYVRKVFREYVTVSFQEYLTLVRMERAMSLLRDPGIPINAIAQMVGYHSDNSFIRAFRNRYGVSPGAWRQSH